MAQHKVIVLERNIVHKEYIYIFFVFYGKVLTFCVVFVFLYMNIWLCKANIGYKKCKGKCFLRFA